MKVTVLTRRYGPPIVSIEPSDVPAAVRVCVADAMRDIRSVAPSPVVIIAGGPL